MKSRTRIATVLMSQIICIWVLSYIHICIPLVDAHTHLPLTTHLGQPSTAVHAHGHAQPTPTLEHRRLYNSATSDASCWYEPVNGMLLTNKERDLADVDCGARTKLSVSPMSISDTQPRPGTLLPNMEYTLKFRFDESALYLKEYRIAHDTDEATNVILSLAICPYTSNFGGTDVVSTEPQPTCNALGRIGHDVDLDDFFRIDDMNEETQDSRMSAIFEAKAVPLRRLHDDNELFAETTISASFQEEGDYYLLGFASIVLQNDAEAEVKMVITNNSESSIYIFEDPVETNVSTKQAQLLSLGLTFCSFAFEFFILVSLIKNRNHTIMKVSQVPFLIAFIIMGMVAVLCNLLQVSTNEIFCSLKLLVNIPLCTMYAILIARLWRIDAITTPVMGNTFTGNDSDPNYKGPFLFKVLSFIAEAKWPGADNTVVPNRGLVRRSSFQSIRRTISNTMLFRIVVILVMPFVAIDTVIIIQGKGTSMQTYESDDVYFQVEKCVHAVSVVKLIFFLAFLMLQILTAFVAYMTKELPSIVNESEAIFRATWINLMFAFAFSIVILMEPSSPNIELLSLTLVSICFVSSMTWFIIVPKLKVVWSGQNVNIQQELQGHQQYRRENTDLIYRRRSWHNQFPITLQQNGVVQRRKSLPIEVRMEDKQDQFSVSKDGFASRRLMTQIASTMNIYEKICEATTSSRIPLSKNDWDTVKVRTSALYKQISKIKFSWDEATPETFASVKPEDYELVAVDDPSSHLIPDQVSTLSSSSTSGDVQESKGTATLANGV